MLLEFVVISTYVADWLLVGRVMLLRFSAQNHLSLKEPQAISLLASSSLKDVEAGLIECGAIPGASILPAAVIYGANASGKSNLVAATRFVRSAVLFSHQRGEPGGGVPRTPFALDPNCGEAPSIFNIDFVLQGVHYHYGFEALDEQFAAEWLYAFPNNRRQLMFERIEKEFRFGRALKGRNRVIADLTRPNSLFLAAATQNHHEQLSEVVNFIRSVRSDTEIAVEGAMASKSLSEVEVDGRVIKFLEGIGTGVIDYRRLEQEVPEEVQAIEREFTAVLQKFTKGNLEIVAEATKRRSIIELAHRGSGGEAIFLDLERESAGTRRLLLLLGQVFEALDTGSVLIVDELDASLHTKACEAILALFSTPEANPHGAQLIATTHDTNLLASPLLRRDQIWFAEKDSEGATHLYPLTDIRTRKGDNIERGYLQGRFGAIAFPGPLSDLVSTS